MKYQLNSVRRGIIKNLVDLKSLAWDVEKRELFYLISVNVLRGHYEH